MNKYITFRADQLFWEEVADKDVIVTTCYELLVEEVIRNDCYTIQWSYEINFLNNPGLYNLSMILKQVANNE